ncbi:MAG: DUF4038 domain-containing protein [Bacteroidota bacterium]|nr:DUF4038 domain-containing protein [Bacteroidota bacterium]
MQKISLSFWFTVAGISMIACSRSPVSVYPDNPHYFYYKGKPLILITSDQHYGAVIDMDFDYAKYLNYLSASGLNLTRLYPGAMFEPPDKYLPGNPLGPLPGRQLLPWAKSGETGANELLAESGHPSYKYDLDRWNKEYFDRLKAYVELASEKNIIVEVAFFNGMYHDCWPLMPMFYNNNIQNIGKYDVRECGLFTSDDIRNQDVIRYQEAYIKKIATELNKFDNLIYDICDEPSLQGLPGGGLIFLPDSQVVPWISRMKDAFLEAELSLPKKHLLGQTVQNLSPDFSGESWCEWLPTEYVKPAGKALILDYKCGKPLVDVESNYYGMSLTENVYNYDAVRLEGWWFMLGGGAGIINLNGEFHRGQETGGGSTHSYIVPQRKILKDFMDSFELSGLSRFADFSGIPADGFCNVLAESGKQYALYIFHGSYESGWGAHFTPEHGNFRDTIAMNNIPAGKYLIRWIDPASGSVRKEEEVAWAGGKLMLETPVYNLDLAMSMKKH